MHQYEDRFTTYNRGFLKDFMGTALKYRTTNFQEIAHRMDTGVKSGSNYRRIQRFFF